MCGRTCMTMEPKKICQACAKNNKPLKWRPEYNLGRKYEGHLDGKGFNTAPQDISPVLASNAHFDTVKSSETVVVPMLWGVIPSWHKGDYRKHGLTTNNCRLEDLPNSKLYSPLLKAGKRCVVLCEGFYEWQTVTGAKSSSRKVYYIFFPQEKGIRMEDKATWEDKKLNLFKVAGLFDFWADERGDKIFSYTVITYESNETLSWLHHRTPAILETQQQVDDWLDFQRVPEKEALQLLTPVKQLEWYQVSNYVNNSRNKSDQCNKPLDQVKKGNKLMENWLKRANPSTSQDEAEPKKVKKEEN